MDTQKQKVPVSKADETMIRNSGHVYDRPALVMGRISLVRSLGRAGVPVILAREGNLVFERASRYVRGFLRLPSLRYDDSEALGMLLDYGRNLDRKPVAFFNGESDVMLFSANRGELEKYYSFHLAKHGLITKLVNKADFAGLAEECDLPVPKTYLPKSRDEYLEVASKLGYPCLLKPIRQRMWHDDRVVASIGLRKAYLLKSEEQFMKLISRFELEPGRDMLQEYIPGRDSDHYDYHVYLDRQDNIRGEVLGHKIRTCPIHFGQGCYTEYCDNREIADVCLSALNKIGYTGVANINVKRHEATGKYYILEINPRFSLWTVIDSACGVNLPHLYYCDQAGIEMPSQEAHGRPRRWLWLNHDFKAMLAYRRKGELTFTEWLKSFFNRPGKIECHIFSPDDILPAFASVFISGYLGIRKLADYVRHLL